MAFINEDAKKEWMRQQTTARLMESRTKIEARMKNFTFGSSAHRRLFEDLKLVNGFIRERFGTEWREVRHMQPVHREYLRAELTYATERQLTARRDNAFELIDSLESNEDLKTAWPVHHNARIRYGKEMAVLLIDELERRRLKARLLEIHDELKTAYSNYTNERDKLSEEEKIVREELGDLGTEVAIHGRD